MGHRRSRSRDKREECPSVPPPKQMEERRDECSDTCEKNCCLITHVSCAVIPLFLSIIVLGTLWGIYTRPNVVGVNGILLHVERNGLEDCNPVHSTSYTSASMTRRGVQIRFQYEYDYNGKAYNISEEICLVDYATTKMTNITLKTNYSTDDTVNSIIQIFPINETFHVFIDTKEPSNAHVYKDDFYDDTIYGFGITFGVITGGLFIWFAIAITDCCCRWNNPNRC
jgi:hypothetical protein